MVAESQIKKLKCALFKFCFTIFNSFVVIRFFKYLEKLSKQLSNLNQKAQISVYNAKLTYHNFYQFSIYYERT